MNNFQYIKDELDKQNLSISWLAKEIGVSKGYVSKLINNKVAEPGSAKIKSIHEALNIDSDATISKREAILIDVEKISIEKYIDVATRCIDNSLDIYILFNSKSAHKEVNLRRFYDYLDFSNSKVFMVNDSDMKKKISKVSYDTIYQYNDEFTNFKNIELTKIDIEDTNKLYLDKIRNKSILLISNNEKKLSILLNILKLSTSYKVSDYAIFKEVNQSSNFIINNQLAILQEIHKDNQESRVYIVGNEHIFMQEDIETSKLKNSLININEYLSLFDKILCIKFNENSEIAKYQENKNAKIMKFSKKNYIEIESDNILEVVNKINEVVEAK